jgi:hypothetical protein
MGHGSEQFAVDGHSSGVRIMSERRTEVGRTEPPLRPVELFSLTAAPEVDDEVKEWKVTALPVRTTWGFVSGDGSWSGGGHRSDGMTKRRWRKENTERETTLWLPDWWRKPNSERAFEAPPPLWEGERVYVAEVDGYLHVITNYKDRLVGFCLAEDHQLRGNETDVWVGTWSIANHAWTYDCTTTFTLQMIDWRYGVPYPDAGATGLGQWRESTDNGAILEVVALDCDSPGSCC